MTTADAALVAEHPEIPAELAIAGFDGVRAFGADPERSRDLLESVLGFTPAGTPRGRCAARRAEGCSRTTRRPPTAVRGAGTVHHVAFATADGRADSWQHVVAQAGLHPTPVIDRFWFRSVYFREPSGVLFELATLGPGFAVDEDRRAPRRDADPAAVLRAPPRAHQPVLTPIENPAKHG